MRLKKYAQLRNGSLLEELAQRGRGNLDIPFGTPFISDIEICSKVRLSGRILSRFEKYCQRTRHKEYYRFMLSSLKTGAVYVFVTISSGRHWPRIEK